MLHLKLPDWTIWVDFRVNPVSISAATEKHVDATHALVSYWSAGDLPQVLVSTQEKLSCLSYLLGPEKMDILSADFSL